MCFDGYMLEGDKVDLSTESDADLVKRARSNPEVFGSLYSRYFEREYRLAYHKVGNAQDADDIASLTFLQTFEYLCRPKDPSKEFQMRKDISFVSLIDTVTHNNIVDFLTYRSRHPLSSLDDVPEASLWSSSHSDPQEEAERLGTGEKVRAALGELYETDRKVLLLRDVHELSSAEVGQAMGILENTVNQQHFRAVKRFKGLYLKLSGNHLNLEDKATASS